MKRLFRISPCPVCGKPASPLSRFYVRDSWICRECADLAGCLFGENSVSTADRLALMRTEEIAGQVQKEKAEHAAIVRAFSADWTNLFVVTGVLSASDRRGKKQIVGIVLKGEFSPGSEARVLNLNAEEPYSITAVAAYRTDLGKRLFRRFSHLHTVREGECACLTVPEADLCAGDILGNRSASDT